MRLTPLRRSRSPRRLLTLEPLEDRTLLSGDLLATTQMPGYANYQLMTFTQQGNQITSQTYSIQQEFGHDSEARGLSVDPFGNVDIFDGSKSPTMSTFSPVTQNWTYQTASGWASGGNGTDGNVVAYKNYVFASNQGSSNNGIIRFSLSGNAPVAFASGSTFTQVALGQDGLLYGLTNDGDEPVSSLAVQVFDPDTLAPVRTFSLQPGVLSPSDIRSIVVDGSGNVYAAAWNDGSVDSAVVSKYDPNGNHIGTDLKLNDTAVPMNIALDTDGQIAVAGGSSGNIYLTDEALSSFTTIKTFQVYPFVTFDHYIGTGRGLGISAGGPASGTFVADTDFSGGDTYSNSDTIDTSKVSNPAPQSVYDHERNGDFTYTIPNLIPDAAYTVRLDFAEIYWNQAGKRLFNVAINGNQVLSNFDIFAAAGGKDIAIARTFSAMADANGQIAIQFTSVVDNAKVNGIEILNGSTPTTTPAGLTATVGNAQATLTWSPSPVDTSYNIYRGMGSGREGTLPYKTGITSTSFTDRGLTNGTTYYYEVSAVNTGGESALSSEVSVKPQAAGSLVLAIDGGGAAAGSFVADTDYSGGVPYSVSDAINTSNVSNPAPQAVYDSERDGNFTYTIGNLAAGAAYTVRLDFAEINWNAAGKRVFNVSINGSQVLSNFDIFAAAGGRDIAIARSFSATADANGQIALQFTTVVDNAKVSGIEILTGSMAPTGLTATPGNAQATLNWSASSGATSYDIYRSTTSGGEGSTPYKTGITSASFTDTSLTNGTTYYYEISDINASGQSIISSEVSAKPLAAGSLVQAIDGGGAAAGSFVADTDFSGGVSYSVSDAINTSNVSNPAPQAVYDSERDGNFTYTIGNLAPGASYIVRLDFAEINWNAAGKRVFNVAINGSQVLSNFDIFAAAGGRDIAIARSFSATADANGQIAIQFTTVVDNAKVSGIEILTGSMAPTGLTATPGNAQATLNWSASSGATSYDIYRSTTSGGEGSTPYKTGITSTSFTDTGLTNGTTYYYEVSAVNANGQSALSSEVSVKPQAAGSLVLAIDGGGAAAGSFVADTDFSGGVSYSVSDAINTSNVSNPAPQAVYDSERDGNFTYTIGNLAPGASYIVRLDFAEINWYAAGKRVFNVSINGTQVLSNFDIFAAAGGRDIAIARSFSATADANGQIAIQFTTVVDNAKVSGIEILTADTAPTVTGVNPANAATNVSTTSNVQVTFSEALDATTVNSSTVQLLGPSNVAVAATVSYNSSTDTVTLTPSSALAANTTYTVLVHGGNSGAMVTDTVGDPLAANFTSSFTTAAAPATRPSPNNQPAPLLPAPTGTVINVSTVSQPEPTSALDIPQEFYWLSAVVQPLESAEKRNTVD